VRDEVGHCMSAVAASAATHVRDTPANEATSRGGSRRKHLGLKDVRQREQPQHQRKRSVAFRGFRHGRHGQRAKKGDRARGTL